jgi:hypothetical protein
MNRTKAPLYIPIFFTFVVLFVAIILAPARYLSAATGFARRLYPGKQLNTPLIPSKNHLTTASMATSKTPVYFLSHGGVSLA